MNDEAAAEIRGHYLRRLDAAMRDIPHGVAQEIRAGVAEELDSASPEELTARLERLGDPEEIAREASRAGSTEPAAPAAGRSRAVSAASTRGFAILAALVLGFGTFLVPIAGWVVGVVLVCLCRLWRTSEKVAAILVPFGSVLLIGALAAAGWSSTQSEGDGAVVVPVGPHVAWALIVAVVFVAIPASGLWLIWRLRGRSDPTTQ